MHRRHVPGQHASMSTTSASLCRILVPGRAAFCDRVARNHGLKAVGLPSRLARFTSSTEAARREERPLWWRAAEATTSASMSVHNVERRGWLSKRRGLKPSVCTFVMENDGFDGSPKGPRIQLALPSFRYTPS